MKNDVDGLLNYITLLPEDATEGKVILFDLVLVRLPTTTAQPCAA